MTSHLLLLVSALVCVWWIARKPEDHIMLTLKASANDIERALNELHHTASTGTSSDARHAGNFLLALWDSDHFPLHLQDFQYLNPALMRQAMQLLAFLMTTGTRLEKFISAEAMDQVADNLSTLNCQDFLSQNIGKTMARPAPAEAPAARTLP